MTYIHTSGSILANQKANSGRRAQAMGRLTNLERDVESLKGTFARGISSTVPTVPTASTVKAGFRLGRKSKIGLGVAGGVALAAGAGYLVKKHLENRSQKKRGGGMFGKRVKKVADPDKGFRAGIRSWQLGVNRGQQEIRGERGPMGALGLAMRQRLYGPKFALGRQHALSGAGRHGGTKAKDNIFTALAKETLTHLKKTPPAGIPVTTTGPKTAPKELPSPDATPPMTRPALPKSTMSPLVRETPVPMTDNSAVVRSVARRERKADHALCLQENVEKYERPVMSFESRVRRKI